MQRGAAALSPELLFHVVADKLRAEGHYEPIVLRADIEGDELVAIFTVQTTEGRGARTVRIGLDGRLRIERGFA